MKMGKAVSGVSSDELIVLGERYGYLREEMLRRLENRYKLLTAFLTVLAGGLTIATKFERAWIGLPVCAIILLLAMILHGENRHVHVISNYLLAIEDKLDRRYNLEPKGWETFSRGERGRKRIASNLLVIGAIGFFTSWYIVFAVIGLGWSADAIPRFFDWSEGVWLVIISLLMFMPLVSALIWMWRDYRRFWQDACVNRMKEPPAPTGLRVKLRRVERLRRGKAARLQSRRSKASRRK